MENDYVKITSLNLSGIKTPILIINGFKKKDNVEILIYEGKERKHFVNNNMFFDNEFSYKLLLSNKNKISIYSSCNNKKELITSFNNSLPKRIINKIRRMFGKIIFVISNRLSYIHNLWTEYYFMMPKNVKNQLSLKLKLRNNGTRDFYDPIDINDYNKWIKNEKTKYEKLNYNPLISVVIKDNGKINDCIKSINNSFYKNLEINIFSDKKIDGIKNINRLDEVNGEYVAYINSLSLVDESAFYYIVKKINEDNKIDIIYTDSDYINKKNKRCNPCFKPDYSPDTLLSYNYITNLCVIRKTILNKLKNIKLKDNYDLILKATEITNNISHINKILYHSKLIENNDIEIINDAIKRRGLMANVVYDELSKTYNINYKSGINPLVSIIIPTKDHYDDLKQCVSSIIEKTTYKNYEIIIVDNGSTDKDVIDYENKLKTEHNNIKILSLPVEFNFSYLNNEAVNISNGEYVILLNNDTKLITSDWIEKMLGYASLKHIGTVGVKLLYEDMTIQHAGIVGGLGGIAAHAYVGYPRNDYGLFKDLNSARNVIGNTAACFMISKEKYLEVGGLEEQLKVAYNDVDFNFKLYDKGYYNVFLPSVELIHYESKSRGLDDNKEKYERFINESNYTYKKWNKYIDKDPFYNKNYSRKVYNKLDKE